jgi:4-hydroxybenzoate polyprenyltransferase
VDRDIEAQQASAPEQEGPPQQSSRRTLGRPPARWKDYVSIARPEHWVKHVFIIPGVVLAWLTRSGSIGQPSVGALILGFVSAALIASANYVLNEWLDAGFDRHHPTKSQRPGVARQLRASVVVVEYALLALSGLGLAILVSGLFALTSVLFLASGWFYNVRPLRTKDRVFLDVISESINNPLRLTLGWAMVDPHTLPPSSLLLAFWMSGAFLMAIKRFAEYRTVVAISGPESLGRYRRSFRAYTENLLLVSAFLYAQLAAFFLAVFLIKYRIEYLLSLPLVALLFAVYLRLGLKERSPAQAPETLWRERSLLTVTGLLALALIVLTVIDLPGLELLTNPHFIELPW